MMKTKTFIQIFLFIFVSAFALWALYEYKNSEIEKEHAKGPLLSQVELENLKAFRIIKGGKQLSIVQKGDEWLLNKPVQDQASFTEISRWLDELKNTAVQKVEVETPVNWKEYHLEKAPRVEMDLSSGRSLSFSVSTQSSFDGKYFIRRGEELFIGELYFYNEVNQKDFEDFRDKKLLASSGHAEKIQFKGKYDFTVTWKDYKWSLIEPARSFPVNPRRLDKFWSGINGLKAESIKEALNPESLNKYGLHRPQAEITFHFPERKEKHVVKFSAAQKDKVYASLSHRDFIFELSKESVENLILNQNDIRDHSFPFKYDRLKAIKVERKDKKNSFIVKKTKGKWKSSDKKEQIVDSTKMEQLLDQIQNLKAQKYQFDPSEQNLRSFEMKDSKDQQIFELREVSRSEDYSWLKTSLWDELTAVSKNSVDEIFNMNIFINSDKKTKEPESRSSRLQQKESPEV